MNIRLVALRAVITCFVAPACIVNAAPAPLPSPVSVAWVATDNDVLGNWKTENGEAGNEIKFSPDHTLAVYDEGYGAVGPYISTWKLVNNHVIIVDAYHYRGPGSEDAHYKAPPFNARYGNDLQVIHVNGHTVLMPMNSIAQAHEYGFAPVWCFWHFTIQHGYATLPQDAIDMNNAIDKRFRDAAHKHKHKQK